MGSFASRGAVKKKKMSEQTIPASHSHSVQFYSDDEFLIECLVRFMGSALGAGDTCVVIATEEHRRALATRLKSRSIDLDSAVEQGRYLALDAAETLAQFMHDGMPDETRFMEVIGDVLARAEASADRRHGRLALFGEMVALLVAERNSKGAIRLEQLWNQVAHSHSFSLLCAYPMREFYGKEHSSAFQKICDEHAAVLPAESYALAPDADKLRLIAEWQQKALALEQELSRLREAQAAADKLAAIVASSEDAIASKDLNGIITSWNASAERMFGWKAEEIIGKSVLTIIPPELHKDEDAILGKIRRGEPIEHFETVRVAKDGRRLDVSLTVSPIKDPSGRVVGAAKIVRDIGERKRAEEALRRAEKLAATGRMAATMAHEINNPLEAVTNLLYLLRQNVTGDQGREHLALAESELARVSHITKQTLAFYRGSSAPQPVELGEVLNSVLNVLSRKLAQKRIAVTRRIEPCTMHAMKGELRQLFSNLVDNAIDAVPLGGEIEIAVEPCDEERVVTISDNGPGIARENLPRLFEPFFTTKMVGTGLGLWVAQEIAEKHGGRISVESRTGKKPRTVFRVSLRDVMQQAPQVSSAA